MVKRKIIRYLGILLIVIALALTIYQQYQSTKTTITEKKIITEYLEEPELTVVPDNLILSIPKINLQKVLYPNDPDLNNVNLNIEILNGSKMPNELHSNLILAGHSGPASNAYFNDLDKLSIGDEITIYYDKIYTYKLMEIKEIPKTGYMHTLLDPPNNLLTMVTCKKLTNKYQLVFTSELVSTKTREE